MSAREDGGTAFPMSNEVETLADALPKEMAHNIAPPPADGGPR